MGAAVSPPGAAAAAAVSATRSGAAVAAVAAAALAEAVAGSEAASDSGIGARVYHRFPSRRRTPVVEWAHARTRAAGPPQAHPARSPRGDDLHVRPRVRAAARADDRRRAAGELAHRSAGALVRRELLPEGD